MDIAALSIAMSQMNVATEVGAAVTKLSMDTTKTQSSQFMQDMIKSIEQSVNPGVGTVIDIKL
ncbi:MAG: YjfB family protein [Cellulosilyticaceae bacterium]